MKDKIKITAVSYLNTEPFIYGLTNTEIKDQITLETDIPSKCAEKLLNGETDIGLIPVAVIPLLSNATILGDYCIGANGRVESVMLYSSVPLEKIGKIMLDYQSRTSVALVKILAKEYWKISPIWQSANLGFENSISGDTAAVVIGDRTFEMNGKYKYEYDLAEQWQKYTGLPFVFACWVSNKNLDSKFVSDFNKALQYGIGHMNDVVKLLQNRNVKGLDVRQYLTQNISYLLDSSKKQGMALFLEKLKGL